MTSRIAMLLPDLAGGGAEKVCIDLASRFAKSGVDCDIVLVKATGELLNSVPNDVRVVDLGASKPKASIPSLSKYLRLERPDALLSSLPLTNIAALITTKVLRQFRGRVVTRIDTREDLYFTLRGAQEPRLDRILRRHLYRRADATIAVSRNVREWLIRSKLTRDDQTHVIYNPLRSQDCAVKVGTHARSSTTNILACGRLVWQKDYPTLIKAFALVHAKRNCMLSILGDGPLRSSLDKLVRDLGLQDAVRFYGFVADPVPYMLDADVFVHTALFEGFGNVLLEALAAGCRIVATDGAGAAREALGDGKFGLMTQVGDESAIANAIETILDGQMVFPSPKSYLEGFDIDVIAEQYLDVLLGVPEKSLQ